MAEEQQELPLQEEFTDGDVTEVHVQEELTNEDETMVPAQSELANGEVTVEDTVTYTVIENSSQRGKPKLLDNQGFSYTVRARKPHVTYWRCAVRNRSAMCGASVIQRGEDFSRGPVEHNHESKPNSDSVAKMIAHIKSKTLEDISKSATSVVREVYKDTFGDDISTLLPGLPKAANLARRANRWKQKMRSEDSVLCGDYLSGEDPNSTPSMVFRYRIIHDKLKNRKKGNRKKKKTKKGNIPSSDEDETAVTAGNFRVLVEDIPTSTPQKQSSGSNAVSDVTKANCLREIAALIGERDAHLKRVEEIEQILFRKYQIPVVDNL